MTDTRRLSTASEQPLRPSARRARLGWSGLLFVLITVTLAVGAVNSQNNLLFWIFGIAVAAVVVSGLVSGNGMLGLRLEPQDIADAQVGVDAEIPYAVRSGNRLLPVFAVNVRETGGHEPTIGLRPACLVHLEPGGRHRVTATWTPARRGLHHFDAVVMESRFPFGFIVKSLEFRAPRRALVTPAPVSVDPRIVESTGSGSTEHRVRRARRGAAGEYFGIRAYALGDARRSVAWKPSARLGELLVVEHAEPRGRSIWVHITRPVGGVGDPLLGERALSMAAALVRSGSAAKRPVGVWAPWLGVRLTPATGPFVERQAARALAMADLTAPGRADHEPPVRPGDAVIAITLGPASARADATLDPARPEQWLAPGAALPAALAGVQGRRHE